MDERRWIVLPFNNITHSSDIEWLRDASVNLLTLDLSTWREVTVVDDKRVADFMREIPPARAGQRLSLNDGLAVARRAGAGKLVMGDLYKVGAGARVDATVYDVRRGEQLRVVREQTTKTDSLIPTFGRLAGRILNVAPGGAGNAGSIGTTSIDAYQEYIAGVQALNRFDVAEAKKRLEGALALDSTFALAHYKLVLASIYDEAAALERAKRASMTFAGLQGSRVDPGRLPHATAAARLSAPLPARERGLIAGLLAHIKGEYGRASDAFGALVASDSSDVEALYGLGHAQYRDDIVEGMAADTTQFRFRSSWNTALRVLRRAITIDPTNHLAFDPILSILTSSSRRGCRTQDASLGCVQVIPLSSIPADQRQAATEALRRTISYSAPVRLSGDSLLTVPVARSGLSVLSGGRTTVEARRPRLERAREAAQEWVDAGPGESRAHRHLAGILLELGRLDEADREFALAASDPFADPEIGLAHMEVSIKSGRGATAGRMLDSLSRVFPSGNFHMAIVTFSPVMGRVVELDTAFATAMREMLAANARGGPFAEALAQRLAPMFRYVGIGTRVAIGGVPDSVADAERTLAIASGGVASCGSLCEARLLPTLSFGVRVRRASWPAFPAGSPTDLRLAPAIALSHADTVALRVAANALDSAGSAAVVSYAVDDGSSLIAAESFLMLGDSARALVAVSRTLDDLMPSTPAETMLAGGSVPLAAAWLWPRAMLLRADLEAAAHHDATARLWYERFIDLWANADPELQPIVARARRAYSAIGGK